MASCFLRARRGISNIESAVEYWTALRVSLVWPNSKFKMAILVCTKNAWKGEEKKSGIGFSFSIKRMRSVWKIYYRDEYKVLLRQINLGDITPFFQPLLLNFKAGEYLQHCTHCPDILFIPSRPMNIPNTALRWLQGSQMLVLCLGLIN